VEKVGTYNPMLDKGNPVRVTLNEPRVAYWLSVGAQPTKRVAKFLGEAGLRAMPSIRPSPVKSAPGKKAVERAKEKAAALAAAASQKQGEEGSAQFTAAETP